MKTSEIKTDNASVEICNMFFTNFTSQTIQYNMQDNWMFNVNNPVTPEEFLRYLKGAYSNFERYYERCWRPKFEECIGDVFCNTKEKLKKITEVIDTNNISIYDLFFDRTYFDNAKPFSYKEAFEINNPTFRALVFGSINIPEMIENLGAKRLATDGKTLTRKTWNYLGEETGDINYTNVYETYEINGSKLGLNNNIYAIKCWCTTTEKEHWLWIEETYKYEPLKAIASTFRVHENVIPFISAIKRQGDILLMEMSKDVEPDLSKPLVPLTPEQYFGLLVSEA
jgi:hypothetical protein